MTIAPPAYFELHSTDVLASASHEQVVFCRDHATGLRAIIALHDTRVAERIAAATPWERTVRS